MDLLEKLKGLFCCSDDSSLENQRAIEGSIQRISLGRLSQCEREENAYILKKIQGEIHIVPKNEGNKKDNSDEQSGLTHSYGFRGQHQEGDKREEQSHGELGGGGNNDNRIASVIYSECASPITPFFGKEPQKSQKPKRLGIGAYSPEPIRRRSESGLSIPSQAGLPNQKKSQTMVMIQEEKKIIKLHFCLPNHSVKEQKNSSIGSMRRRNLSFVQSNVTVGFGTTKSASGRCQKELVRFPSGSYPENQENKTIKKENHLKKLHKSKVLSFDLHASQDRSSDQHREIVEISKKLKEHTRNAQNRSNVVQLLRGGSLAYANPAEVQRKPN